MKIKRSIIQEVSILGLLREKQTFHIFIKAMIGTFQFVEKAKDKAQ
jgi:hypothetical protein